MRNTQLRASCTYSQYTERPSAESMVPICAGTRLSSWRSQQTRFNRTLNPRDPTVACWAKASPNVPRLKHGDEEFVVRLIQATFEKLQQLLPEPATIRSLGLQTECQGVNLLRVRGLGAKWKLPTWAGHDLRCCIPCADFRVLSVVETHLGTGLVLVLCACEFRIN